MTRAAATERHTYRVEVSSHPSRRKRCRPSMAGRRLCHLRHISSETFLICLVHLSSSEVGHSYLLSSDKELSLEKSDLMSSDR